MTTPTEAPDFVPTWLPVRTYETDHPQPQHIRWQGPGGASGSASVAQVLQLETPPPNAVFINMIVVSAAAYPPDYWASFESSSSWRHENASNGLILLYTSSESGSTVALRQSLGFIIQLTTKGISDDDTVRIMNGVRWR